MAYSDLKTPRWQRIVIWIIAIAMAGGTLLGFFFMAIASKNPNLDPNQIAANKQQEEYEKYLQSDEYKKYVEEQKKAAEERQKKLRGLDGYTEYVATFNADDVKELKIETLKEGDGATVKEGATISANYTGWAPDGKIFDSTKLDGEDATAVEFSLSGVIKGWGEGLAGARAGGVYLLTIPADQAYGATGSGCDADGKNCTIAPNTPLKFLVQVVSTN